MQSTHKYCIVNNVGGFRWNLSLVYERIYVTSARFIQISREFDARVYACVGASSQMRLINISRAKAIQNSNNNNNGNNAKRPKKQYTRETSTIW